MCFYSAPWPSYYIAHSLQLPVVFKLIRNLNVMASQLKRTKKKKGTKYKRRVLLVPLSFEISSISLAAQGIKARPQFWKLQTLLTNADNSMV